MKSAILALSAALFFAPSAAAQGPGDLNQGATLRRNAQGEIHLSWWGRAGMTYFLQTSVNLVNWTYLPQELWTGANQVIDDFEILSPPARLFLRLQAIERTVSDPWEADFDGHGLSNGAELEANTDPDNPDSDGDGVSDGAEATAGLDPKNADSDADGVIDGADDFPADALRSESIPVKYYGVLNLAADFPGGLDVRHIALNDANQVAFASWQEVGTRVYRFANGETVPGGFLPHDTHVGVGELFTAEQFTVRGILSSGEIYGNVERAVVDEPDSDSVITYPVFTFDGEAITYDSLTPTT